MRIHHLRASNFYGGPERQLHLHARQVQGSDCSVSIASFTEYGQPPEFLTTIAADDIPTYLFHVKHAYDYRVIAAVRDHLVKHDVQILCTHEYRTHLIGWLATRGTATKWVAFSRGWTKENAKVRIYHACDKFILRFADHIVAVSEAQRQKLARLLISTNKITVVHNAIAPERFCGITPVNLHSRFGLASDSFIYVCAGRFSREKGQIYLVKAAAEAVRRNSQLRFVLFGEGPDLKRLRSAIAEMGLNNEILCPGFEENLIGCIKGANAVVNPSLSEGLPNVVLEAMALGVPVVATAVGGVPEIITHEKTGYLVPPKKVAALTEALLYVSTHPVQAGQFAQTALQLVNDRFTFARQNELLTAVYHKVLS